MSFHSGRGIDELGSEADVNRVWGVIGRGLRTHGFATVLVAAVLVGAGLRLAASNTAHAAGSTGQSGAGSTACAAS